MNDRLHQFILLLPVLTTLCSAYFVGQLYGRYRAKGGGLHLLWWGLGMVTYGLGTATEAYTSIIGWSPVVFRLWYIVGAFLGGYPLAQGTIFLLMGKTFARRSAWIVTSFIALASVFVVLTPLDTSLAETHRLSGQVISWQWVRLISPFINLYSVIFLVGGAIVSASRFRLHPSLRHRYLGNIWIAVGAILPGIGGALTRAGYVEALYITELVGLLAIYRGYRLNVDGAVVTATSPGLGVHIMKPKTTVLTLLVCGALAFGGPSQAQANDAATPEASPEATEVAENADEPVESFFAATTVTATGNEIDAFEVANPVNIISAYDIELMAPQNAADILRSQPGVDVDGVGANQSRPIIRGQRGLRVLFLENGLRMNNPRRQTDFGEIPGLVDIDSVDTMEVVRGPSSVLYGSDAVGGVLNLVTHNPIIGQELHAGLRLRNDSAGDSVQGGGNVGGGGERTAYKLGFSSRTFDDYEAPSGTFGAITLDDSTPVVDSGVDDSSFWGAFSFEAAEGHDLYLRLNRYRADDAGFGFVEPELIGDPSAARVRILYPFQDFERYTLSYSGSGRGGLFGALDSVDARLYHQNNERELVNDIDINIGPIFPGAPASFVLADTRNFTDIESIGTRLEGVKALGDRHLVTFGIEGYEDDSFNTDASVTTTQLNFPGPPFTVEIVGEDTVANAPNANNSSLGAFVHGEFVPSDRWKVAVGVRQQTVSTNAEATPGWDTTGLDFEDDATVGSASVLFRATDTLHVAASWGTAFRAPNIIERLFNGLTPEGIGFQILNSDLVSEASETFDLGLKYRSLNGQFEINYFQTDIDDGIVQYFLTPDEIGLLPQETIDVIDASGVAFVVQQRNIDRLRYEGVELMGRYRLGDSWTLSGNFTKLDAERIDSINPPTGDTYGEKINVSARYQATSARWWAEYRGRHNGEDQANLEPGEPVPAVGVTLPDFTIHTLAGGILLFEGDRVGHELAVTVDNLTDELYAEFSNSTFFRPQPGQRVITTYRLRF